MSTKPKKFNLNEWVKVSSEEELEGYQSIIIVPPKLPNGIQSPSLYYRKGKEGSWIKDIDGALWDENCKISTVGTDAEYIARVEWWVKNAMANDEYKNNVNNVFGRNGFNIRMSLDSAIIWLSTKGRKSALKTFLNNWFTKGFRIHIDRLRKNRGSIYAK